MEIIRNLVPEDRWYLKCPHAMDPDCYVVHNTANDASAEGEVSYMITNDNKVSFHYAVDDIRVVQGVPENRNAWHAGDGGYGPGNRRGIGVEICWSMSGGERFEKAERNAAKFLAERLYARGWGIDRVRKHQDFSGKYCPHRTLDLGWARFLAMVQAELDALDTGFVDVPLHSWYTNAVIWAAGTGIASGVDAEHFAPDGVCTRAQAMTFLWRAVGKPDVEQYGVFEDVPGGAYYAEAVNWAYWSSVSNGIDNNSFGPDQPCTRSQVITFLWRAMGRPEPALIDGDIKDVPECAWYRSAVHWALEKGITTGTDNHRFSPNDPCTRAQIVTMLWRAFKK